MHNLSVSNGRAEMFSGNNVTPWHKLGTVVAGLLTAKEAIGAAHLDWNVAVNALFARGTDGQLITLPDHYVTQRQDNGVPLGVVKSRYEVIQNAESFDFFDSVVGDGKAKYETAGALDGGRQVWIMAKYDGDLNINGDEHRQWILLHTAHDGTASLTMQFVTERVVCANTLSIALRGATHRVSIRHCANWEQKAKLAQETLGLADKYFGNIQAALAGMNERLLTSEQMAEFNKLVFPSKPGEEDSTRLTNIRNEVKALFHHGDGNNGLSRWDALQAVTDYADHSMTVRGGESKQEARFSSSLLGSAAALKQRAFEMLTDEDVMDSLLSKPFTPSPTPSAHTTDFARLIAA